MLLLNNDIKMYQINISDYGLNGQNSYFNSLTGNNEDGDIDSFLKDKVCFHKISTLQVSYLIKEREGLRDYNIKDIDHRIMYCHETLSRFHMMFGHVGSPKIEGLQKLLFDLEKQRRNEFIISWHDTLKLKLDLMGMLGEYQTLKKQEALLEDVP